MSAKLCIMTAYADETRALLKVLGQEVGDSVDWNNRLQFECPIKTKSGLSCSRVWAKCVQRQCAK